MILRSLFLGGILLIASTLSAQQTYIGTVLLKTGGKQTGTITVNLDGANNELIGITKTEKLRSKGTKGAVTTSTKLNTAIISSIIINDTTWYFRDIKVGYNEKYDRDVCVRLMDGKLDCGMFQVGRNKGNDGIAIKLPNNEFSKLVSTEFEYYKETSGWHAMGFGKCEAMQTKMIDGLEGYKWDAKTPQADRIAMWKKWIREFNECK